MRARARERNVANTARTNETYILWGGAPSLYTGKPRSDLWHFDGALRRVRALTGTFRAQFDALVRRIGGEQVIAITPVRPLERANYVLGVGGTGEQ